MKHILFILFSFLFSIQILDAQCYCEDCPELIINGAPSTATLNVSGATNNILGAGGQSLVNVSVQVVHSAVQELSIRLVAPDGSFVDLMIGEGLDAGPNIVVDVDFVQCSDFPLPDCTNNSVWTSTDNWDEGPYMGSYYPELGCLEDLTGDINGTWTVELEDVFAAFDGELLCFDLTFADNTGISCNSSSCGEILCLAQGGNSTSPGLVISPVGDPLLIIDYTVSYNNCEIPPSEPEYIFVNVIYEPFPGTGNIIEIIEGTVDMTTYPSGDYTVQGLSILASDLPIIQALDFSTTTFFNLTQLIFNGTICAESTTIASQVMIGGCLIDFSGMLEFDIINAEEGDPALDPNWNITWTPAAPDFTVWGVYYVVFDQTTQVLVDYFTMDDFTSLPEGNYFVAMLVYDLNDEPNLPLVNGTSTFADIANAILIDDVCGITFGLNQLFITAPCVIDFDGTLESDIITAPENDPSLDPNWNITFTGTPPDPADYGFFYVVYEVGSDLLIALYTTDDFTLLGQGNYNVSMVYYDLDQAGLILTPNGINTFTALTDLIDNGTICGHYFGDNELVITPPCEADAGMFLTTVINECEGSSGLLLDLTPQYTGAGPSAAEYGYTYVVSQAGIIIEIDMSQDFTSYGVGVYEICGLSYLLSDQGLLPSPNGTLTTSNIETDIVNDIYCADLMTTCLTLTINEVPNPIFTGPDEACAGESVQYTVDNFSGNSLDYLFTIEQGGVDMMVNDGLGTLDITWSVGPGSICVTEFSDGCDEQTCIAVNVLPQPDFMISGLDLVCPDQEEIYTFDPAPVGLEFYDVSVLGGTISNQTGNTVTILWDNDATGSISAHLLGGICDSEEVVFNVTKVSNVDFPVVMIPSESCISTGISIDDISDPGILSWAWTATNVDIDIDNGFVNFTWQSTGIAEICLDITTFCGMDQMCYDVDIFQGPSAIDLTTICDGDSYIVEFEIDGGEAPFMVNGDALVGTLFTSMPINSGDNFNFTIVDADGCSSELIQGTRLCNCVSNAGTMGTNPIEICGVAGADIIGSYFGGAALEANDAGQFVLHTNASNVLGTILALNNSATFTYDVAFGVNVTLYISHIVGDDIGGNVDLNDNCLSVSLGQPVVIVESTKVDAGEYLDRCDLSFELSADDKGFDGVWAVISAPLDAVVTFENISDASSNFETDLPGSYSLSWTADTAECIEADTTTFELKVPLMVENVIFDCAENLETYIVSVEISGGESPFYLNGIETTNPFDLPSLASGDAYSQTITDARGCDLLIEGMSNCECMNEAGTMSLDTLKGCIADTLVGTYNDDAVLDMDDRALFVLHSSSADTLGAVFYISEDPIVFFTPNLIPGNIYYLSHIMGNESGPGIDYQDPCLKVSIGQPVIFVNPPVANAGIDQAICGLTTDLNGSSPELTTTWSVIESPIGAIFNMDESDLTSEFSASVSGQYLLELEADNGYCKVSDTVSITFIEFLNYQDLNINCSADGYTVSFTIVGGMMPYSVDGTELSSNTFESEQIPLGGLFEFIISDVAQCTPVTVDGFDTCECENDAGTMNQNLIELCIDELVDVNTLHNNDFILDDNDIRYYAFHTSSTNELGNVIGYFQQMDGVQELTFTDFPFEAGVTYYISTVLANMGTLDGGEEDLCLKVAPGTPIVWNVYNQITFEDDIEACFGDIISIQITASGQFPFEVLLSDGLGLSEVVLIDQENFDFQYIVSDATTLTITPTASTKCLEIDKGEMAVTLEELPVADIRESISICNSEMMGSIITLEDLIVSGYDEGEWMMDGNEITDFLDFDGFAEGIYQLDYKIESTLCATSNLYVVTVNVENCDCPIFDYTQRDVTCFDESDGSISIVVSDGIDLEDYLIFLNDVALESKPEITELSQGSYTLDITDGNDCVASFEIDILEPDPVQISLGGDMEAEIDDPVVIEAITNLIAQEIDGITWSSLEGILEDNDLTLNTSFHKDDLISINIIDENGCEATDEIMVRVTFADYIIPNVINTNSVSGNDVFRIYNSNGIDEVVSFTIYDRWGNEVFGVKSIEPDLVVWDGTFGGKSVNSGVYVYRMEMMVRGVREVVFGDLMVM